MKRLITISFLIFAIPIILNAQWTKQNSGTTESLFSIDFIDEHNGWAVGNNGLILHTNDGGLTWKPQSSQHPEAYRSVFFTSINEGFTVGSNGGGYTTNDGGDNWNKFIDIGSLRDVYFFNDIIGFMIGDNGHISKTTNGGIDWAHMTLTTNNLYSTFFISEAIGFIAGSNVILKTSNGGTDWNIIYENKDEEYYDIVFVNNQIGYVVGRNWGVEDRGRLLKTTDGGDNWVIIEVGEQQTSLKSISLLNEDYGWIVGGNGTILTMNDGELWTEQNSGTQELLLSVDAIDNSNIWIVGTTGTILKYGLQNLQKSDILKLDGQAVNDRAGSSVSSAGDVNGDGYDDVIVGARNWQSTGRAYVYYGGPNMDSYIELILSGESDFNYFGESVSTAGDVNGDGYDDVIVGAFGNDGSGRDAGRAYIYYGGNNMNNQANLQLSVSISYSGLGKSVSTAGDVNGDGYDDVIVGAWTTPRPSTATGRAYIYFGGPSMDTKVDIQLNGESSYNYFGESVSTAGDVNGDGYDDVIVGAFGNETGGSYAGRAYIYFGGPNMDNAADITLTGESGNYFGNSVSNAGDVNGDGFDDVIIGSTSDINGPLNIGRAHIFYGGNNMNNDADVILNGEVEGAQFGYSVSTAGDINNDGYDDVVVGAKDHNESGLNAGKIFVYYGAENMDSEVDIVKTGEYVGDEFGTSVSSAGDVDGDGHDELIVGAPFSDIGGDASGRAYLYYLYQPTETPTITFQPLNSTIDEGQSAVFKVVAECDDPIGYQWWRSPYVSSAESKIVDLPGKIVGSTTNQLTILNTSNEDDNNTNYYCEVYNTVDHYNYMINTNTVTLTVNPAPANAPIITLQPSNIVIADGFNAVFEIRAECDDPIGYQWWRSPYVSDVESKIVDLAGKIEGATTNKLKIIGAQIDIDDTTKYYCEVYNTVDQQNYSVDSDTASVTIKLIRLLQPSGGEEFIANSNLPIIWETQKINNIKIDVSLDGGNNWNPISSGISAANNSYDWIIPETTVDSCYIRISDLDNSSIFDISDSSFAIKKDQIMTLDIQTDLVWIDNDFDGVELGQVDASESKINFGNFKNFIWTLKDDTLGFGIYPTIELPSGTNEVVLTAISDIDRIKSDTVMISVYSSKLETNGPIYSSVSQLEKDALFIASTDDKVYRFDSTGTSAWTILTGGAIQSTICISNEDNIYVGSEDTRLYAFNKYGTPRWDKAMGGVVVSSPSVGPDNNIYVGLTSERLISMDESGNVLWSTQVGGAIVSSPSISNSNNIYFGACDNKVYQLSKSGDILNIFETQDSILSSPAIASDGSIYIGANDGYLYKLDKNLNLLWKLYTLDKVKASPVIDQDGNVFVGSTSGYFYALSSQKDLLWKYKLETPINGNPSIGPDGSIYVGTTDGRLVVFNSNGMVRWSLNMNSPVVAAPLITDLSLIYIGGLDGNVYIIKDPIVYSGFSDTLQNNQWPTFKGNNQRTGFVWDGVTDINELNDVIPANFSLAQNYPNPFNPSTKIKFGLPSESKVTLVVYNILGQEVAQLVNQQLRPGYHEAEFNFSNYSSGIYFYRLQAGDYVETKKMILLK